MSDLSGASCKFNTSHILNFKMSKGSTGAGNGIVPTIDLLPAAIAVKTNKSTHGRSIFTEVSFIGDKRIGIVLPFLSLKIDHRFFVDSQFALVHYIGKYSCRIAGEIHLSLLRHIKAGGLCFTSDETGKQQK